MGRFAKHFGATTSTGRFSKYFDKGKERTTYDTSSIENLKAVAESKGLEVKEKKPSKFRRFVDIISRPLYTSAGIAKAVIKKENIAKEAWKGFTGKEKETYSDVLAETGVKNKWVKGIVGFALDVALDPLTYFGGAAIKGVYKGAKAIVKPVAKLGAKAAPESALHLADAAKSLKDAFGTAFVHGYGTTAGLGDDVSRAINKMGMAKEEVIESNVKMFGKKPSEAKIRKATELMMNNRLVERGFKKGKILKATDKETNAMLQSMKAKGQEIAKKSGIKGDKWYFPWLDVERIGKKGLEQSKALKVGQQGYLKQFRNLIKDEKLLKKPIEAYSRREFQVVRDNIVKSTMDDMVRTYGKQFKNVDEAVAAGYKPIYKKSPLQFFKVKTTPAEDVLRQVTAQNEPFERAMIKVGKGIQAATKEGVPVSATKRLRKAQGAYYPTTNEIKLKYFKPDVLLHERGHSWDFINDRLSKVINTRQNFQKELRVLTDKFYGGTAQKRGSAVEKWAVFVDNFIHNPKFVKKNAPMFTGYFRRMIKTDWKFKQAYQEAAKQIKIIDKTVKNIKPALLKADKGFLKTAIETAFPSKEFIGVTKAKPLGYLKETDAKFIDNYLFPEMKTLDTLAKASGYDSFTRWFKTWVTAYFPAFHVRNYISGNVQNYSEIGAQALNPKNHNAALGILYGGIKSKPIRIGKYTGTTGELNKVMKENFRGASRYISDIGDYVEEVVGNKFIMKKVSKARQVGNFIEMNQKAVALSGALRKGETLKQAIKSAERAGFDYSKITQFESKIMRRLVPFYTFARKNAELQVRTLAKHPERIVNQVKIANAFSVMFGQKVTEEDVKGLPDWALEGLGFKVSGNRYFTKTGFPLEELIERVNKPMMSTLSSLNPLIKYPMEAKMGFDFFREQKTIDINKVAPATGELLMKAKENGTMPDWFNNAINIKSYVGYDGKTKYTASPRVLHAMRNIPTSRFQNSLERMFDGDLDKTAKWLSLLSGAKVYDIDVEQQKYFQERDLRRDIEDQLLQRGIGDTYESFYIKKD